MSGNPQETRENEQGDLLEQIITQGLDKLKAPTRTVAEEEPPAGETPSASEPKNSEDAAPSPTGRKNRRSAVYLYLLILFGAAFLMLLLAYFVQQRSSKTAISDLRESMNLSREELLDEIRELKEQNAALNDDLARWQERYEEKDGEVLDLWNQSYDAQERLYSWTSFWELEQYYQAGDLIGCAAVLIIQSQGHFSYHTPDAARERYEEIVQAVIDAGILDKDYYLHPTNYNDVLSAFFVEHTVGTTVPN